MRSLERSSKSFINLTFAEAEEVLGVELPERGVCIFSEIVFGLFGFTSVKSGDPDSVSSKV